MKTTIINCITLILALTGAVFAFGDQVAVISFISPKVAQYWPFVLALATAIDRICKIIIDILDDGELNDSSATKGTIRAPGTKPWLPLLIGLLGVSTLVGCATDPNTGKRVYVGPPVAFKTCYIRDGMKVCGTLDKNGIGLEADFKQTKPIK